MKRSSWPRPTPRRSSRCSASSPEHVPDIEVLGIGDVDGYVEPVEDQPTFEGNALLKARAGVAATGLPTIADDSGLCVDALNGMPGVLSARWSARLARDKGVGRPQQRAAARPAPATYPTSGAAPTSPARSPGCCPTGASGSSRAGWTAASSARCAGAAASATTWSSSPSSTPSEGLTSAELEPGEKDRISHRGRALRELAPHVAADLASG